MHYFSGKGCSESLESMHYCIGILMENGEVVDELSDEDQKMWDQYKKYEYFFMNQKIKE